MIEITDKTHYDVSTGKLFELERCEWCNGKIHSECRGAEEQPDGVKLWGDENLPPESCTSEYRNVEVCSRCDGKMYYVDQTSKSKWVIGIRPRGEVHSTYSSLVKADKACDNLNDEEYASLSSNESDDDLLEDSILDAGLPETEKETEELTNTTESTTLASTVVIRLAGNLNGEFQRGDHFELPQNELLKLINKLGAKPMAKTTERKTAKNLIRDLIIKKKSDDEIIEGVQKEFPESNVDSKHCTKYRRELFVEEKIPAALAAVRSEDHQDWVKATKANLTAAKKGPHKTHWTQWEKDEKAKEIATKKAVTEKKKADTVAKKAQKK